METSNQPVPEQGLLDLSVELSTSDVTAGNEFAIFVLVKNPFSRPVWVREVNVSLPSELKRADGAQPEKRAKEVELERKKENEKLAEQNSVLLEKINHLSSKISQLTMTLGTSTNAKESNLPPLVQSLENDVYAFTRMLNQANSGTAKIGIFKGAAVDTLRVGSRATTVEISGGSGKDGDSTPSQVRHIEILEPWLINEEQARARTIKLKSSLPENSALQPGSTAVYTVILNVKCIAQHEMRENAL